jgi:carbonyl reductase 1
LSQDLIAFHPLDVTSDKSVAALVQWLRETYGGLDILVNNAGISYGTTEAEIFDTNYYGVKRVTKALLPLLRPSPAGARIIMVSSSLGMLQRIDNKYREEFKQRDQITEDKVDHFIQEYLETSKTGGWPEPYPGYSMTKVALNGYTSVLAREVEAESKKVYVNCFAPGYTKTNLNDYQGTHTLEEAAMTGIWLALHPPGGPNGKFFDQQLRGEREW